MFGTSRSRLSSIFNDTVKYLYYRDKLEWNSNRLSLETIKGYAEIFKQTIGVSGVWGFVDGTMRPFYRLGGNQQDFYSCHNHVYISKYYNTRWTTQ